MCVQGENQERLTLLVLNRPDEFELGERSMDELDLDVVARAVAAGQADGQQVGVGWLQRKFRIGFNAATALKQRLEASGVLFVPIVWPDEDPPDEGTSAKS